MFTGIIESLGEVMKIEKDQKNIHLTIKSAISNQLKIDQSISHNGVCLTVVNQEGNSHKVTAIDETLQKTNFKDLTVGSLVNLERCLKIESRLDGHLVQGHVDEVAKCIYVKEQEGSWRFGFEGSKMAQKLVVNKGSICINGVSLTVTDVQNQTFEVAIIPYTYENTTFKTLNQGDEINVEYDIIGKYILKNSLS